MDTADIRAAINTIPAKKEDLRKAFEELESYSSSFASFTLQWKDIDDHLFSIEKSIDKRFQELKEKVAPEKPTANVSAANVKVDQDKPVIEPRPELMFLCVKMDVEGLRSYIIGDMKDLGTTRRELAPALLYSPDPVTLVLDLFEGCVWPSEMTEGDKYATMNAFLSIIECLHGLRLEVKPSDKERAMRVAIKYYDLCTKWKNGNAVVVMIILHLIATFGLLEYFAIDHVLNLLVKVAKKKDIVDICRNLALGQKMPDLIDKLNKKGRQLDSVKFVLAFNLKNKFPPASLFKAYLKKSKQGFNMNTHPKEAISKQITAIREVIKTVEEYNLGSQYPIASLQNRIQLLEKSRSVNIRAPSDFPKDQWKKKKQHQPPNKQPRPSDSSSAPVLLPPPSQPHSQIQPQLGPGLVGQSPFTGLPGSYGLISPEFYAYSSATGSTYYNRPVPYSGFPHNPSPHP